MKRSLFAILVLFSSHLFGEDISFQGQSKAPEDKWGTYLQIEGKKGNFRTLMRLSCLFPVWQDENSMLFGDIRFMMDNIRDREGNFGLGYRKIIQAQEQKFILGGYAFYDRKRSPLKHWFNQAVFGLESLGENYQVRGNYYYPQNKKYTVSSSLKVNSIVPEYSIKDSQAIIGIDANLSQVVQEEISLKGFDAEGRYKYAFTKDFNGWLGLGYYRFARDGVKSYGPIGIIDLEALSTLRQGDRLTLGYEYRKDKATQDAHYAVLKYAIPLGEVKGNGQGLSGIDYEMTRFIERDVDAITGTNNQEAAASVSHQIDIDIPTVTVLSSYSDEEKSAVLKEGLVNALEQAEDDGFAMTLFASEGAEDINIPQQFFSEAIIEVQSSTKISDEAKKQAISSLSVNTYPMYSFTAGPVTKTLDQLAISAIRDRSNEILDGAFGEGTGELLSEAFMSNAEDALNSSDGTLIKNLNPAHVRNPYGAYEITSSAVVDLIDSTLGATAILDADGTLQPAFKNVKVNTFANKYEASINTSSQTGADIEIQSGEVMSWADLLVLDLNASKISVSIDNPDNKTILYDGNFAVHKQVELNDSGNVIGANPFSYLNVLVTPISLDDTLDNKPSTLSVSARSSDLASTGFVNLSTTSNNIVPVKYQITDSSILDNLPAINTLSIPAVVSTATVRVGKTNADTSTGILTLPDASSYETPLVAENGLEAGSVTNAAQRIASIVNYNASSGDSISVSDVLTTLINDAPTGSSLKDIPTSAVSKIASVISSDKDDAINTFNTLSDDNKTYAFSFMLSRPYADGTTGLDNILSTAESKISEVSSTLQTITDEMLGSVDHDEATGDSVNQAFLKSSVTDPTYALILNQIQETKPDNALSNEITSALSGDESVRQSIASSLALSVKSGSDLVKTAFDDLAAKDPVNRVEVFKFLSGSALPSDSADFTSTRNYFLDALQTNTSESTLNDSRNQLMTDLGN